MGCPPATSAPAPWPPSPDSLATRARLPRLLPSSRVMLSALETPTAEPPLPRGCPSSCPSLPPSSPKTPPPTAASSPLALSAARLLHLALLLLSSANLLAPPSSTARNLFNLFSHV